jgi:hypothetical protein
MLIALCPRNVLRYTIATNSYAYPVHFLTLRARAKYTYKFENSRESGQSGVVSAFVKDLPGATRNSRGGLLCQSAHFNRASDVAPRRTDFARV